MNKKGIELAVNFVVILILSVIVFGMGIYMVNMFFKSSEDIKEQISKQTEDQIMRLLISGDRVSIPITKQTIKRGRSYTFGVGVLNVKQTSSTDFAICMESGPAVLADGSIDQNPGGAGSQIVSMDFLDKRTVTLKNNEHEILTMPVSVPGDAAPGDYVINVYVLDSTTMCLANPTTDAMYDKTMHKIRIHVP